RRCGGRRRHPAAALSAADLGIAQARRHLPRVRARRSQHPEPVPRDRSAELERSAATNRRAGPAPLPSVPSPNAARPPHLRAAGPRSAVPVINITKTRVNVWFTWFIGTNDQPGDYRHSGCASCHVVYANDRDPRHSSIYAKFGHEGRTQTVDPTISKTESGHPLTHTLTRSVPTSQCMICHMHQPNMFLNTFLGYTMWDYESDAPRMWPEKQQYPDSAKIRDVLDRNPEGAATRGKWADVDFLKRVSELNQQMQDTQFADYHGHGWNFRAVFKRDRKGNLLDAGGNLVGDDDPQKFKKAVHLSSIHVDAGMQCVDCHYSQDNH